jgi:hypothetical protein
VGRIFRAASITAAGGQRSGDTAQVVARSGDQQIEIFGRSRYGMNAHGVAAEQHEPNLAAGELRQYFAEVGV